MEERNSLYKFDGIVQVDEFYLGGKSHGDGKRGRGTDQDTVMIGLSLKKGAPVHCFMELVGDMSKRTVLDVFFRRLTSDVILETDGNPTYAACAEELDVSHLVTLSSDKNAHEVFKWVDTLVSNLKSSLTESTTGGKNISSRTSRNSYIASIVGAWGTVWSSDC